MGIDKKIVVLLVEDEFLLAMSEKSQLEQYGYRVTEASSGEKAVEAMNGDSFFDIILMDIDLGRGIDGTQAAEIIMKNHDIPIIFLSSHMEPEIVEKTEKITSYGYVVKNSSMTVLDASIKMAMKLFNANKKMIEYEMQQQAMNANISDVILLVGADGTVKYVSPNIEKIFGWKPEDLSSAHKWNAVHPDDQEMLREETDRLMMKANSQKTIEQRYRCKDGSYKLVEVTAKNMLDDPIVNGVLINYHDITESRRSKKELDASEERFKSLVHDMSVGVLIQGSHAEILMSNPKAFELLGLSEDQLLGKSSYDPDWKVIHEDGSPFPGENHPVPQAIASRVPVLGVIMGVYRPTTNSRVWLMVDAIPHLDDGELHHVVCTFVDISRRKQAEESLRESEEKLRSFYNDAEVGMSSESLQIFFGA